MKLLFSKQADADPVGIKAHIASDNPSRAGTFTRELAMSCHAILDAPLAYAVVDDARFSRLRRKSHKGYVIFYAVAGDTVEIVRILHGARDIPRILRTDEP